MSRTDGPAERSADEADKGAYVTAQGRDGERRLEEGADPRLLRVPDVLRAAGAGHQQNGNVAGPACAYGRVNSTL
jgi:hypothetical protein